LLPRAILFDMDDTLVQAYGRADETWLAIAAEFAAELAPLSPVELSQAVSRFARDFWADAERHRFWRLQLGAARREVVVGALAALAQAGHRVPAAEVGHRLADRFTAHREENAALFPDAHAVVDAFRARGVRLALVTNGASDLQRAKIQRFDLARRFDHIQIEGEHEFGKPDERAYLHAMRTLEVEARDTWMVGDHLEWEVAAPQRLGIYAIWCDTIGKGLPAESAIRPDRIIRSLSELLATPAFSGGASAGIVKAESNK
jgi:putative hydrolase of the HAD superfamily